MWIATTERSREIDRMASAEYGIPAMVLMERAGLAVFDAMRQMLPEGGRVTIFCGKGNNGGDGLVLARHALKAGYHVDCLMACLEGDLSPDAATQLAVSRAHGVQAIFFDDARWLRKADCVGCRDLVVDALLGTGSKGAPNGMILSAIRAINRSGVPAIAVDVPSGIDPDTGEEIGESVWALKTITLGQPKPFLFQGIGLEHAGYWEVADIGYPTDLLTEPTEARLLTEDWVAALLPERLKANHKGDNGSVLIVAGSHYTPGAASLAALGAAYAGAGLVTVAAIPTVCDKVQAVLPEATLIPLPERDGTIGFGAEKEILERLHRYDSLVVGPGLGLHPQVRVFLEALLPHVEIPVCLDADALTLLAEGVPLPAVPAVLTPHPGEMGRLIRESNADVQSNRFNSVQRAIQTYQRTFVLKGPYSIVGEDQHPLAVNSTGNPGMASAGMGDVLSGVIGTLLAQELPAYLAAACGVYWHGTAGDLCAESIGGIGYQASDLARKLPAARAKILESCQNGCESNLP